MTTLRQAYGMVFCILLSGCGNLSNSIEQRVEISEECRLATARLPARFDTSAPIASITLGDVGYCDIGKKDTLLPICSRNRIKLKFAPDPSRSGSTIAVKMVAFDKAAGELDTALRSLASAMRGLDARYKVFLTDFSAAGYVQGTELMKMTQSEAQMIQGRMQETTRAQLMLLDEIVKLAPDIETQAYIELRAWDANLRAQLGQLERLVSGDVSMLLREGLRDQVSTHVAQRSLDLLHGALKAPTAVMNRLDKEAYGAVSVGYLMLGPNIQSAVNQSFGKIKQTYTRRITKSDGKTSANIQPFLNELRRAACNRLLSGTEFSLLSELVDTMLILQIGPDPNKRPNTGELARSHVFEALGENPSDRLASVNVADGSQARDAMTIQSPQVSPLAVYASNQWMARQQLLEEAIAKTIQAGSGTMLAHGKGVRGIEAVNESAVQRLAESATAKAVDDATRQYPALLESTAGMDGILAANVNVSTAASAVSLASVVLDVNISVSNTNTFNPTNYNNVSPVIHLPAAAPQLSSLCANVDFAEVGAMCLKDGDGYVLTFVKHFFGTDSCQVDDLAPALSDVAQRLSSYGRRHGVQYDVAVEGHASHPAARMAMCKEGRQQAKLMCRYRNQLHSAVDIVGCRAAGGDRNVQLSAARARRAAEVIEHVGDGVIVVRQIAARGAHVAHPTHDKKLQAADQTIVLRLRQQGVAALAAQ